MEKHPLANKTVKLNIKIPSNKKQANSPGILELKDKEFRIEDWVLNMPGGKSWMDMNGNPACLKYAIRSGISGLPTDDNVVYGKVDGLGHLIHESELGKVIS